MTARHNTRCRTCHRPISRGDAIRMTWGRAVHASCETVARRDGVAALHGARGHLDTPNGREPAKCAQATE